MEQLATSSPQGSSDDSPVIQSFKVYKPCDHTAPIPLLPDEYYSPTPADLRDAQATLAARTQSLINAPLQTQAMRASITKSRKDKWPFITIRVKFPDRSQLEKVFPSSDKIKSVYAFVRGCLREDVKPIKFILYQSPPRKDFKVSDPSVRDLTLADLQLAPSSVLLLRFEADELNAPTLTAPLAPSILSQAIDMPAPPTFDHTPTVDSQHQKLQDSSGGSTNKLAKWLKLGISRFHKLRVTRSHSFINREVGLACLVLSVV
ncbi:hypothetical protein AMATHDRAFT_188456 [Amanita thiersii Skay4041]|uniref:UBX domain-containing protein n=1 Tax=Amanita thiersii Skay4041 TaxID=703135 RepID=A0A2A9NXQ2_9AGAR|nr:hypothetical protein AMATHDRAFT_188456 [Amanita thiersii Skay4041]